MDLNRLTRDADDLIRKVVSRYNQLYVPAGTISQVELDLMLDDIRKLYDTFKHIGYKNLSLQDTANKPEVLVDTALFTEPQQTVMSVPVHNEKPSLPSEPVAETIKPETKIEASAEAITDTVAEPESENGISDEKNMEFITETEYEIETVNDKPFETASEIPEKVKPAQPNPSETNSVIDTESAHTTLADRFNTGNKSLSETIASSQTQGVMGSRLQFQPISDLINGIGLNDKFSFISELFANNAILYDEAINRINKAVNLDEANWILQKYHSTEWDHKHETLARMKAFIKRRFI